MTIVLDTHVFLWWLCDSRRLSRSQARALRQVTADNPAHVCDISLWEIATLSQLGRIRLKMPLRVWLDSALEPPGVELQAISSAITAEVAALPDGFHRDPADRIIVSTARVLGAHLLTCDEAMASSGLVPVIG
jgi:PIN domain nuclease of toxin-antitoxin system